MFHRPTKVFQDVAAGGAEQDGVVAKAGVDALAK